MTLNEFVKGFMEANNIKEKLEDVIKVIFNEANKVKKNNSACFGEDEIEKIILLSPKLIKEMNEKKTSVAIPKTVVADTDKKPAIAKPSPKVEKKTEKKGEKSALVQTSFWD